MGGEEGLVGDPAGKDAHDERGEMHRDRRGRGRSDGKGRKRKRWVNSKSIALMDQQHIPSNQKEKVIDYLPIDDPRPVP